MNTKKIIEIVNKIYRLEKELRLKNGCGSHLFIKITDDIVKCEYCDITKKILNIAH